jgi:uncharacterized protein
MQVTEDFGKGRYLINAYGDGFIMVNQQKYQQSLILTPKQIIENWCDCLPDALTIDHLASIDQNDLELIILGTGTNLVFPPAVLTQHFLSKRIGFEVMDSGAACRTYNILISERRRVAAAILVEQ